MRAALMATKDEMSAVSKAALWAALWVAPRVQQGETRVFQMAVLWAVL